MNIKKMIRRALAVSHTISYPIEQFTVEDLMKLSKEAGNKNVELRVKAEHSNFYQGTLLQVQRLRDRVRNE